MAFYGFHKKLFEENVKGPKAIVLKTYIERTFVTIKIIVAIQTLALIVFVCYPIYGLVANNLWTQIMPMQFPFIDQQTTNRFIVAN